MLSVTLGAAIGPFAGILISRHVSYDVLFISAALVLVVAMLLVLPLRVRGPQKSSAAAQEELAGRSWLGLRKDGGKRLQLRRRQPLSLRHLARAAVCGIR